MDIHQLFLSRWCFNCVGVEGSNLAASAETHPPMTFLQLSDARFQVKHQNGSPCVGDGKRLTVYGGGGPSFLRID